MKNTFMMIYYVLIFYRKMTMNESVYTELSAVLVIGMEYKWQFFLLVMEEKKIN